MRWAHWDRSAALEGLRTAAESWPQVSVRTGTLRNWPAAARLAERIQRAMRRAPFAVHVSARRVPPELPWPDWVEWLDHRVSNGLQALEYLSPALERDPLAPLIGRAFESLSASLEPMRLRGWEEWYDMDPTIGPTGRLDGWVLRYGRPPRLRRPDG